VKILNFILSLNVLVLSSGDCCADENCTNNDYSAITEHTDSDNQKNDCNGDCSPFLTCGSCIGFNCPVVFYSLPHPQIEMLTQVSIYQFSFSSEFVNSIWQPPKIS
jgi:hypothetical protein